jgi:hypothetical protein
MIVCKNCEFDVNSTMRHSLVKNCCPSCGGALLGDLHRRRLDLMKQRILEQEFSQNLSSDLVFDISLFMMSEFFPSNVSEEKDGVEIGAAEEFLDESGESSEGAVADGAEEDYGSIRDEVRSEMLVRMEADIEHADEDLKVARLKRIAKENKVRGSGPSVRRVTD